MSSLLPIQRIVRKQSDRTRAVELARFFKTGKGEYGEGDVFLGGLPMPTLRVIAKEYRALGLDDVSVLLASRYHEERMLGLLITVLQYERGDEAKKREIFSFLLTQKEHINNWDLVDVIIPRTVGDFLLRHPSERVILLQLVRSKRLWDRRIAVLATFPFIKAGEFEVCFETIDPVLYDHEDLMHKAVGWMLREVGKKNKETLMGFLRKHATSLPRTTLRYAIERLPERERAGFLKAKK